MKICGIVAEYNPFHRGHAHQLAAVRRAWGEDCALVCCMSGDFVQRGEAAVLPKHARARAAVREGADLVLELPAPYALRSAEGFAQSAVDILAGLGVVDRLSFGAEDADASALTGIADVLLEHATVQETLAQLKTGISYAAARERALYAVIREQAALLQKPNNILAVEYCKELRRRALDWEILPIPRVGAGHDEAGTGDGPLSASAIRLLLRGGDIRQTLDALPLGSADVLRTELDRGRALLDTDRLECAMLPALSGLGAADLAALPGAAEGLENRLLAAIHRGRSLAEIAEQAKTKRYALARLRRMLFCAYLGITREDAETPPPYVRVLAFNDRGREVLRLARKRAALPLVTKPAHASELSPRAARIFALESRACDLYSLALPAWRDIPWGQDWREDAVFVRAEEMARFSPKNCGFSLGSP